MSEVARGTELLELIPEFALALARCAHPDDANVARLLDAAGSQGLHTPDEAHLTFLELAGALNDYAPPGSFFGPRPGDPTSFGFWELPAMEQNAIRQDLGGLDEAWLSEEYAPRVEKRTGRVVHPGGWAAKLREAIDALAVINELQEAGALFVHNNSGGKDSQAMLIYMIEVLGIPAQQIVSIHADLGAMEWQHPEKPATKAVAEQMARHYGVEFFVVEHGRGVPLTERVTERVMTHITQGRYKEREGGAGYELVASPFPSAGERWCTSEYKTAPCEQLSTDLAEERGLGTMHTAHPMVAARAFLEGSELPPKVRLQDLLEHLAPFTKMKKGARISDRRVKIKPTFVVHGLGLRADESDDRGEEPILKVKKFTSRSTKTGGPLYLWRWLPIQLLKTAEVFRMITAANQEPHWVYGEGLTRASCSFCIFASPGDMKLAAKLRPDLYAQYVALETHYGKSFSLRREFLEDMTKIQADEALVSQYRRDLVPVEELVEKYGGVFEGGGRVPEEKMKPYRRLGFREEEKLVPAGSLLRKRGT